MIKYALQQKQNVKGNAQVKKRWVNITLIFVQFILI